MRPIVLTGTTVLIGTGSQQVANTTEVDVEIFVGSATTSVGVIGAGVAMRVESGGLHVWANGTGTIQVGR